MEIVILGQEPPLHQSTQTMTGCAVFYGEVVGKNRRRPSGLESVRGTQVHHSTSSYLSHCARKGVAMDLEAFDRFAEGVGPMAAKILVGMRESYKVDHEHLFATELTMSLDEQFRPTHLSAELESICDDSEEPPAYQGTLDAPFFFRDANFILVDDFKTHPRPYDPSEEDKALQGRMYSLFCFLHFSWVEKVTFRLVFVRYKNLTREVTYTRTDVPKLIEAVKSARSRQLSILKDMRDGKELSATPGDHCQYCPRLSDHSCPIAEFNENMQLTYEQRVQWDIWNSAFSRVNKKVLTDRVQATGYPVVVKDYNGRAYRYGPRESESQSYPLFHKTADGIAFRCNSCGSISERAVEDSKCPKCGNLMLPLMPIVSLLESWASGNPGDTDWMGKIALSSSSFSSYLKAKSRAFLHQSVQDTADTVTKVKFETSKPLDSVPTDDEPDEGDEWDDEEF